MGTVDDKEWAANRQAILAYVHKLDENGKPYGRNRIAKELGLSRYRIDKICKQENIKFDRSQTAQATQAYSQDTAAVRTRTSRKVLQEIEQLFERMNSEHTVIGWHQGMAFEHQIKRPTATDYKNYIIALGVLIDKHLVLERYQAETQSDTDSNLIRVQLATETARILKANPELSVEQVINEVTKR